MSSTAIFKQRIEEKHFDTSTIVLSAQDAEKISTENQISIINKHLSDAITKIKLAATKDQSHTIIRININNSDDEEYETLCETITNILRDWNFDITYPYKNCFELLVSWELKTDKEIILSKE